MGPKKKKANKAREEYLEKRRLDREAAAAAKEQQQGEVAGGHGDQASAEFCGHSPLDVIKSRTTAKQHLNSMNLWLEH